MLENHTFENRATFSSKIGSPKHSSYSDEDIINGVGTKMMYTLHHTGVKLMDLKKIFGIKYATTNHTPCADIRNDPGMEYSPFNKAH